MGPVRKQISLTPQQDLVGFNNTGNVCVWPAEEVLAFWLLTHGRALAAPAQRVLELGAGMAALAGFAAALAYQVRADAKEFDRSKPIISLSSSHQQSS